MKDMDPSPAAKVGPYKEDRSTSVLNQYIAATIVSVSAFCYGSAIGWVSPSLETLQGPLSPLGALLTAGQVSAVASLFCVGGLLGSVISGMLADRLGRRWTGLLIAVPYALCWILKLTASSVTEMYIARVLAGLGGGGSLLIAPMYSLEIGSLRVRGSLGSITILAMNAGVLFSFVIGAFLSYDLVLWMHLAVPLIYFVVFFFMPETPTFLVKEEKYQEASKAIAWLRNTSTEDPVTLGILENLKQEALLASKNMKNNVKAIKDSGSGPPRNIPDWKFFLTSKATLKAFGMCFIIITIQGFVGVFAIISFVSDIFAGAGSSLSPSSAAIIVAALQLVGTYGSILLVDRLGRKILFIASCTILGLGLATLGTYFHLRNLDYDTTSVGWIPVVALSLAVFMDAAGVGPIPFVIANEVFVVQAHGIAVTFLNLWIWVTSFIETQFYKAAEEAMGSDGIFWAFSAVALSGAVYTIFLVPETKGKTLDEILQHFDGRASKKTVEDRKSSKKTIEVGNLRDSIVEEVHI